MVIRTIATALNKSELVFINIILMPIGKIDL